VPKKIRSVRRPTTSAGAVTAMCLEARWSDTCSADSVQLALIGGARKRAVAFRSQEPSSLGVITNDRSTRSISACTSARSVARTVSVTTSSPARAITIVVWSGSAGL